MEDGVLILDTEYGEMKIDWTKVIHVTSTKPMKVRVLGETKGLISDFFLGGMNSAMSRNSGRMVPFRYLKSKESILSMSVMTAQSRSGGTIRPETPTPKLSMQLVEPQFRLIANV